MLMKDRYNLFDRKIRDIEHRIIVLNQQKHDLALALHNLHKSISNNHLANQYQLMHNKYLEIQSQIKLLEHQHFELQSQKRIAEHKSSQNQIKAIATSTFIIFMMVSTLSYVDTNITGFAVSSTKTAISNVTIAVNIAIQSNNLSSITWGSGLTPNTNENPALGNADGSGGVSTYNISMGPNTSTAADFCIEANDTLTSGASSFPLDGDVLTGYNYSVNSTSNEPIIQNSTALTTNYVRHITNVAKNGVVHYRFWLDVPPYQETGEYINNVTFKVISSGTPSCDA